MSQSSRVVYWRQLLLGRQYIILLPDTRLVYGVAVFFSTSSHARLARARPKPGFQKERPRLNPKPRPFVSV